MSDYPGIEPYLAVFPYSVSTVQQASWVVTIFRADAPTPETCVNFGS